MYKQGIYANKRFQGQAKRGIYIFLDLVEEGRSLELQREVRQFTGRCKIVNVCWAIQKQDMEKTLFKRAFLGFYLSITPNSCYTIVFYSDSSLSGAGPLCKFI